MTITMNATALVAAAVLTLTSCKHEGDTAGGGSQRPRTTSPAIDELLAAIPGNAAAIGFLDLSEPPWSLITGGGPLPLDEATRKSLDKELREYVERYLGVDVSRLQYAVGFVSAPPPRGAVLLKAVHGALKMPGARDIEGAKVWLIDATDRVSLAIKGDVVVFGETTSVQEVLETLAGKHKPVTEENKPLVEWLRKEASGAAFAIAGLRPKDLPMPPPLAGIERAAAAIGASGIAAVIEGDDAAISALQTLADQAFAKMLAETDKAHDAAQAGTLPPPQGAMAIIASAYARSYAARLKPRRSGNRLSASLDIGFGATGGAMVVPVIGILSAVAIPTFMDYIKRSKQTEASLQLNKLGKNAKRAYSETSSFPTGSAPLTPPAPCCGQPNNHCTAVPTAYAANAVWRSLDFQIDEPSLFQYSYQASSDGQRFVAKAIGDLDCDGVFITYELSGAVSNGNPVIILTEPPPNSD
jgi:Tfp pilus assembly major pilin PilA